jgi:excisionase family DNA binding protein
MTKDKAPESLTLSEAGRLLGLSYYSMYAKVRSGLIPAVKVPSAERTTWRIPRDTIAAMLKEGLPNV